MSTEVKDGENDVAWWCTQIGSDKLEINKYFADNWVTVLRSIADSIEEQTKLKSNEPKGGTN